MGVRNNECVIATTWDNASLVNVCEWLEKNAPDRFCVIESPVNNYRTIFLAPDGSNKGWPEAELGKSLRDQFINHLDAYNYSDGSSPFDWVEVGYGEFGQKVLQGNCINRYSDKPYEEDTEEHKCVWKRIIDSTADKAIKLSVWKPSCSENTYIDNSGQFCRDCAGLIQVTEE